MVLNAAVQTLREADELKQKILKFKSGTSMLQERSLWTTQQELQKVYQKVLVLDLDYALDKKVEQDLWNIGFKQQIEALQAISKDRKSPMRSEGQAMLSWVLQAAAGFYLCLLHQICTNFKLDLPFRRRASLLGLVEGWGTSVGSAVPPAAAARYICQHCLIHLGDLARYRQQLRVANTFYRQALAVSAHSGQPYNQLALLCWRRVRRLGALYWHVRAVLVRAPFPPAAANLAHTLRAAVSRENSNVPMPVLLGMKPSTNSTVPLPARLDTHSYVTYLLRALHNIHTLEQLDSTPALVKKLNSSLTALIATDSFEPMTLIKMACVVMWVVETSEGPALSAEEARGAAAARALAGGALLALLLPACSRARPQPRTLPPLKVWLSWALGPSSTGTRLAWLGERGALWPALAHTLNQLAADTNDYDSEEFSSVPLSEDCELLGFTPLEHAMEGLVFPQHAAWDCYGGRVPTAHNTCSVSAGAACGAGVLRARRVLRLGVRVAQRAPALLSYTEVDGVLKFTATLSGDEDLSEAIAEAAAVGGVDVGENFGGDGDIGGDEDIEEDEDVDGDVNSGVQVAPPLIISEADFREKVREKRLGILKPQGSLERAREERALATQEDQDPDSTDENKSDDKKEGRKPRVNIAMAAIMRKQEETNKQVKFVTPPPTPDSTEDANDSDNKDKPKIIQPKPIKSLANLPTGRKTGGILSLKDKSAGYPHLVNAEPEPKKTEKEEKKEIKPSQNLSQNSQSYQQKRQEHAPSPSWNQNQGFNEGPRMGFQKNYGIQTAGISYNPNYAAGINSQGIRLPVVNPKEIDVRTAAMQKQNSRQELFQDGNKFGNYNYPVTGDKKNFMSDLPPRFANQYRYWNTGQEASENKFRDDTFKNNQGFVQQPQRPNWVNTPTMPESFQVQLPAWWTPDNQNFNYTNSAVNVPTNFYNPHAAGNTYQMPSYPMQNQTIGQQKELNPTGYLNPAPQLNLQNLSSANFNSSLNKFGSYAPPVGYDSAMYPQFNSTKLNYPPPLGNKDKTELGYHGNKELEMPALSFDLQQRNLNFNEGSHIKSLEQMRSPEGGSVEPPVSTYSLFSAAHDAGWGPRAQPQPHQSLWSGPGPSPLERLLEQQKQMKQPPAPQ